MQLRQHVRLSLKGRRTSELMEVEEVREERDECLIVSIPRWTVGRNRKIKL